MPIKITTRQIYENTGELKKLLDELEAVQAKLRELRDEELKNIKIIEPQLHKLTVATQEEREEVEKTAKQVDEISKRYKKYNDSLDDNAVKISALKNAQTSINQVNKLEAKLLASKEGSYNKLSAQYSLNKIRLNQMSKAERETTKEGKDLVKQSAELYEEMKRLQEETGKHTLNVGNYKSALEDLPNPLTAAIDGIGEMGNQFKALLRNPVVAILAAIVGALIALGSAFTKSEKGAALMAKATGFMSGLMSSLVKISVDVVEGIERMFNDPVESMKNFGKLLLENVLNRVKALPLLAKAAGDAFKALWERDLTKLKEAGEDAFFAINQAVTGLDEGQQKKLVEVFQEVKNEVNASTAAFIKLEEAKKATARSNRALSRSIEELSTAYELNAAISDDDTKSFKEREAASEAARVALEAKAKKEIQLARNNLALVNQEISIRRANKELVSDLLDEQLSAYQALAGAEREYTLSVQDNESKRAKIVQDRLERDLDIVIDGFDNQKSINEKLIASDKLTLSERRKLLEETKKLSDTSFEKQIEIIQSFTGIRIASNELISESDAVVLNEKIRALGVSEIIEGRLLEIVRDRKTANFDLLESTQDLADAEIKYNKDLIERAVNFNKKRLDSSLEAFTQRQDLAKSEFDLVKSTEEEKTIFTLQAEKERLEKVIEINEAHGGELSALQIETIRNQIAKVDQEIASAGDGINDIYDVFGFDLEDEKKDAIASAINTVKGFLDELTQARIEAANAAVELKNKEVDSAKTALDKEIENRDAGLAHSVQTRQKELEDAKKAQDKALEEQKKAQRAKARIDTLEQTTSLVTASAKIWGSLGFPFAIPALAFMWGSFIAAKARASALSKKTLGKGGWEILKGGSHASGRDTFLYNDNSGSSVYGEQGEANATISKAMTSKYRPILGKVFDSLNAGVFEDVFKMAGENVRDINLNGVPGAGGSQATDTSTMEKYLRDIRDKKDEGTFFKDGVLIEKKGGNIKITHGL